MSLGCSQECPHESKDEGAKLDGIEPSSENKNEVDHEDKNGDKKEHVMLTKRRD